MTVQHAGLTVPDSAWFKSSYSSGEGGQCVEVATGVETVHIRDSKQVTGPVLSVPAAGWAQFISLATGQAV
ncbi:DUF397 domain-containing protein [Streptomyces clavifer]|uniref:DUF397 domain-containing protein n=1 Tax=Streptomyces clavifer TaxID=68188 RepID=UPI002E81B9F8|nr:DUF397 domain-containing protein [Streptomyces clavifer]WRY80860.1 DUF397 domain-containing protein [Streptomyces clavifer]WUC26620.1 DUF397 domain-containing protein [Streptomyces clavifer]